MGKQKAGARGFRLAPEPVIGNTAKPTAAPKALPQAPPQAPPRSEDAVPPGPSPDPGFDDPGTLPESYEENLLFLVARDPELLFTYWDIAWERQPQEAGTRAHLRLYNGEGEEVYRSGIAGRNGHWYIPVGQGGATFRAEVGFFTGGNEWMLLARSNVATTPASGLSPEIDDCFATVPYHLAFQKALDFLEPSQEGESFLDALHRMQREVVTLLDPHARWGERERAMVAALLGRETAASLPADDEALGELLCQQLRQRLDSAGLPTREESLWSPLAARAARWTGADSASWFSALRPGGESSWSAAAAREREAFWSAFPTETGGDSSRLAGNASETLASPGLSSFGLAATSWSTAPGGHPRGFFFHLNAEVTYYGGTEPGSKVWIDGKEIPLAPDGTFRFHHRFGEGLGTIPILVQSPDGVETRSALLRLERRTECRGAVATTPQPAGLEPLPG